MQQIIAAHAWPARDTSRDDHDIRIRRIRIVIRPEQAAVKALQRGALSQIQGFPLRHTLYNINQDHIAQFLRRGPVGGRRTNISCPYNGDFGSQPLLLLMLL
jgi:hypothetical protein